MNFDLPTNTLVGALVLALLGAAIKYVTDAVAARRRRRLERCTAQIEKLYGPLVALSYASSEAWKAFRIAYAADRRSFWNDDAIAPSEGERQAWRIWMSSVFMPLNERMEEVIVGNLHLLEDPTMPQCLLDLCAHVESYRGVIAEWQAGRYEKHTAVNDYPTEVHAHVLQRFTSLMQRRADLIDAGA